MKTVSIFVLILSFQLVLSSKKDYDAIITIDTIKDLQDNNLKIVYKNDQIKSILDNPNHSISTIGVLGLRNRGKTFVLNHLTNNTLPSGFNRNTEGISLFIEKEEEEWYQLYLDSKSISQPSKIDWEYLNTLENPFEMNKGIRDSFEENIMIEKIMVDIIYHLSSTLIIIVVDDLEFGDQKLIEQVLLIDSQINQESKNIIIVHNMKYINTKIQLDEEIERIKRQFYLEIFLNNYSYIHRRKTFRFIRRVEHLFFAQENSEAGDFVNKLTLNRIKYMMRASFIHIEFHPELIFSLSNAVKQNSILTIDKIKQFPQFPIFSLEDVDCKDIVKNLIIRNSINVLSDTKCRSFHLKNNYQIFFKMAPIKDEVGIFISEINYEILSLSNDEYLIIVDLPGNNNYEYFIDLNIDMLILINKRTSVYQNGICQIEDIEECKRSKIIGPKSIFRNFSASEISYSIKLPKKMNKDENYYHIFHDKIREYDGQIEFPLKIKSKDN